MFGPALLDARGKNPAEPSFSRTEDRRQTAQIAQPNLTKLIVNICILAFQPFHASGLIAFVVIWAAESKIAELSIFQKNIIDRNVF